MEGRNNRHPLRSERQHQHREWPLLGTDEVQRQLLHLIEAKQQRQEQRNQSARRELAVCERRGGVSEEKKYMYYVYHI